MPAGPTAANPLQWRVAAAWADTDRQTDTQQLHRACITYYAYSDNNLPTLTVHRVTVT